MELQEMKDLWKAVPQEQVTLSAIEKMTHEKSQPILRKFKLQLLLELILWLLVSIFYYNAFDGAKRPVEINLIFVIGFLQAALYNASGYFAAKNLIAGENLSTSLPRYVKKLKAFRWMAICSRGILMLSILLFFTYGLEMETRRLVSIIGILVVFGFQLFFISFRWSKRIAQLNQLAVAFNTKGSRYS